MLRTADTLPLPPHSVDAEQCLIGGLLLDNTAFDRIADLVSDTDFYRDDHRRIYRHICKLIQQAKPADAVTVAESIERSNEVNQTGGLAYLAEIANATPSAASVKRYAEIIRERAIFRNLIGTCNDIAASAINPAGRDAQQILDEAERRIFNITESGAVSTQGFVQIQPVLSDVIGDLETILARGNTDGITGTASGFADLDEMTSGFHPGDMIVIAGRPSMGKTAIALNMAEHVAIDLGLPVAIFSMEMSDKQLGNRFLSSVGRIDQSHLRTGRLTDEDWEKVTYALSKLHNAPIHIDDTGALSPTVLRSRARRLHRQHGRLGLIVIDYLQLMSSGRDSGNSENRSTELGEISRAIKSLAKELEVPIIALSQLSRKVEERTDKRPLLSDLRESGAIEQDADIVIMMYREEYYKPDTPDKGLAEAIVTKHRNGPVGTVKLTFLGEYTKFANALR